MARVEAQERGDICILKTDSLCCTAETNNIVKQLSSNLKFLKNKTEGI